MCVGAMIACHILMSIVQERDREFHMIHFLVYVMLKNISVKPRWQDVRKTAF